jgi:hypothetical protein
MALTANQYTVLKRTLRAQLSGNRYAPRPSVSEPDLLSFVYRLFNNASGTAAYTAGALSAAAQAAVTLICRAQLTDSSFGTPSTPSAANVSDFFLQLGLDSLSAAVIADAQYQELFRLFQAMLSDDGPGAPPVLTGLNILSFLTPQSVQPYTGQVATRCGISNSVTGTAGHTFMSRTAHVAMDNITSLQLVEANWYVVGNSVETAGPSTMALTASVEFPAGTFTQVKYSGIATGSVAGGTTLVSDACAVTIPVGSTFFVRRFVNSASGTPYNSSGNLRNLALGDATSIDDTDKTMGGTIVDGGTSPMWPAAIIATTTRRSVAVIGDSRVVGNSAYDTSSTTADTARGEICKSIGRSFAFINMGVTSDTAAAFVTSHTLRVALAKYCSTVINNLGINDMVNSGSTPVLTHEANMQTIQGYFNAGTPYYVCTLAPFTTSTDNWATTSGQTVTAREASRTTWNNRVRNNLGAFTGGIEIADAAETARDSGIWVVNGSAGWATGDGLHESTVGNNRYAVTLP